MSKKMTSVPSLKMFLRNHCQWVELGLSAKHWIVSFELQPKLRDTEKNCWPGCLGGPNCIWLWNRVQIRCGQVWTGVKWSVLDDEWLRHFFPSCLIERILKQAGQCSHWFTKSMAFKLMWV